MSKRWISLGEPMVEHDGSNLLPVAAFPIVGIQETIDENGRYFDVIFERTVKAEELFTSNGGVHCIRRVEAVQTEQIRTANSKLSRWILASSQLLIERQPRGGTFLDRLDTEDELTLNPAVSAERRVALRAAFGNMQRSVIDGFRPVTDSNGNFTVNPNPVMVAKRN